jgi:hypothetical protein
VSLPVLLVTFDPESFLVERTVNIAASTITIALFVKSLLFRDFSIAGDAPSINIAEPTRLVMFLLMQAAVAYLVHFTTPRVGCQSLTTSCLWLFTLLVVAQWATYLSLALFYPEIHVFFTVLLFLVALVVHALAFFDAFD